MNILYGVVGEGMGHATRSRVVIEHLRRGPHRLKVVVSGRAYRFLAERFAEAPNVEVVEIQGLHLKYAENRVLKRKSLLSNLEIASAGLQRNVTAYQRLIGDFHPELIFSDFESWAWAYGRRHQVPVVSIDNMQILNRCAHGDFATDNNHPDFQLARLSVKAKLPRCYHYLISSFFFPRVRKRYTTLVPPILRPEILSARREPGEHVLVYQTSADNAGLLPLLRRLPWRFRVYGLGSEGGGGNVELRPFSEQGFVEDLRTAKAALAGGGFSLMCEAVHLHVPLLAVPIAGQYEQQLNARYLQALGYGEYAPALSEEAVVGFLERSREHQGALEHYRPRDNAMLLGCVDELTRRAELGEPRPVVLDAPSMGDVHLG